ncbi:myosin IXb [Cricetulus griseus]
MGRGLVALRLSDALALRPHSASGTRKWERAGERRDHFVLPEMLSCIITNVVTKDDDRLCHVEWATQNEPKAFGNAKTAHNNNSSRFGKFIQVNYLESGIVRGNYHVFYYLLLGVSEEERQEFRLKQPQDYFYLNQHNLNIEDGEDLKHDFERLQQAMEMVGFLPATKKQIFSVLSAILYLGNVTYKKRATGRDEGLEVGPPEVLDTLSELLKVKRETLVEVLTKRKTVTVNDKLILPYSLSEAITARDSMAKSLYSALFDWIVLRINHALLNKKDMEEAVSCLSIGVLDIFGFEDFEQNSFEQFCINYANEQLQYYFTQHIFKLEQEEYQGEGISWHNIDYTDNVGCIHLISKKPTGLFYLLDEESNFPHATSHTLLAKFKQQHEDNKYFQGTPVLEPAFIIQHFAGRVKYQIKDFREKNMDYMRPDIVALLRGSDSSYVRQLIGMDPVAVFRWAVLRAAIRAMAVLREAGRLRAERAEKAAAGISSPGARSHTEELPRGANTPAEKLYRDLHNQIIKSLKGLPWQGEDPRRLLQSLSRLQKPRTFFLKSKGIKQKQIIPKNLLDSKSLRLIIGMTLHDRTTKSLLHLHKKKKPPSISAQFQVGQPLSLASSAFKRLFLHKVKDKKPSLEGSVEEAEGSGGQVAQEAPTKKSLEALSSQQHRHAAGEKPLKGKKNRNRKVGQITVSEKWRESVFRKITNANELKFLDEFLLNKVNDLRSQKTPIESLFIEATERFRSNIKTMYSVPVRGPTPSAHTFPSPTTHPFAGSWGHLVMFLQNGKIHVGYKDLMENYQIVVNNLAAERGEKDTNLVLNVFQSLLDEFTRSYTKTDFEPAKVQEHNGHVFASYQVNIPQSCEQCLSYIWLMDKALLCSVCKMTCHKKCVHKIQSYCSYTGRRKSDPGAEPGHFGVCVDSLTSDKASVPIVLEKLLEHVEMHGLYTEGLYRKSGAANRTRELRQALQTDPAAVKLEDFPIHAITGVLKQWLRELPEPLMTFAQYGDFLRAVALLEDVNRMSPGALAIIFAPCLLRCPDNSDPLTSMKDVLKITTCVEMLIKEQMRKYKMKMEEINQLEAAESIAFRRLSLLRQNAAKIPRTPVAQDSSLEELEALPEEAAGGDEDREKEMLMERIQSIKEEKQVEDIAYRLPELDPRGSDEENLDSETSASTESLLEERGVRGAVEGPPVPALPCPSVPTLNPLPAAAAPPRRRPTSFVTVRVKTTRRTPIMPMANIKLPPGLSLHLTSWAPALREATVPVRRREPPARRQDQVHSVYIAPGAELMSQGTLESLDHDVRLPGAKRRMERSELGRQAARVGGRKRRPGPAVEPREGYGEAWRASGTQRPGSVARGSEASEWPFRSCQPMLHRRDRMPRARLS